MKLKICMKGLLSGLIMKMKCRGRGICGGNSPYYTLEGHANPRESHIKYFCTQTFRSFVYVCHPLVKRTC